MGFWSRITTSRPKFAKKPKLSTIAEEDEPRKKQKPQKKTFGTDLTSPSMTWAQLEQRADDGKLARKAASPPSSWDFVTRRGKYGEKTGAHRVVR